MRRAAQIQGFRLGWCREGESNSHSPFGPADFKSLSQGSAPAESNTWNRISQSNPVCHDRFGHSFGHDFLNRPTSKISCDVFRFWMVYVSEARGRLFEET